MNKLGLLFIILMMHPLSSTGQNVDILGQPKALEEITTMETRGVTIDTPSGIAIDTIQRDSIISQAKLLRSIYKTDEALELLYSIVSPGMVDEKLFSELGDCHFQNSDYREAGGIYVLLQGKYPDNLLYKIRLMVCDYRLNNLTQAVEMGKHILETDTIPAIMSITGDAYNKMGQIDSALICYTNVLKIKPYNVPVANKATKIYLDRKEYDKVINISDSLLKYDPDNFDIAPVKAFALFSKKEYSSAIPIFERQDSVGNKSYGVYFYLGQSYWNTKKYSNAKDNFLKAWQVDSSDYNLAYAIAAVNAELYQPFEKEIKPWLDKALNMMQPDPQILSRIYQQYGSEYFKSENWASALKYYKMAYAQNPKQISYISTIGYCYERLGDNKNALKWYEKYLKVARPDSNGYKFVQQSIDIVKGNLFMEEEV